MHPLWPAGNEIRSSTLLPLCNIEESNTRSSKASGGICGNGPLPPAAQSSLAKRIANKRQWSRLKRRLIGPLPLKRCDLSRPSDPIEKAAGLAPRLPHSEPLANRRGRCRGAGSNLYRAAFRSAMWCKNASANCSEDCAAGGGFCLTKLSRDLLDDLLQHLRVFHPSAGSAWALARTCSASAASPPE